VECPVCPKSQGIPEQFRYPLRPGGKNGHLSAGSLFDPEGFFQCSQVALVNGKLQVLFFNAAPVFAEFQD
jgi:hypothetical protein